MLGYVVGDMSKVSARLFSLYRTVGVKPVVGPISGASGRSSAILVFEPAPVSSARASKATPTQKTHKQHEYKRK